MHAVVVQPQLVGGGIDLRSARIDYPESVIKPYIMVHQQPNAPHLKPVDQDILRDLAMQMHAQSISLFISTHQRGNEVNDEQDIIVFKNYVQRIRLALEVRALPSAEIINLIHPLENLLDDMQVWRYQQQGLAVFRNPDFFAVFHSTTPFENSSWLDAKFHLQPLLHFAFGSPVYCLLQIGKKGFSHFKADTYTSAPLTLANEIPLGLDQRIN